jgi:branched-subunit amino acid ABC-type transport system permease component
VVLDLFLNGLVEGSLLALICVGYSLAYGTAKVINFAHADVMIAGGGYLVLLWVGGAADASLAPLLMSVLFGVAASIAALTWLSSRRSHRVIAAGTGLATFAATLGLVGRLSFSAAALIAVPITAGLATAVYRGAYLPLIRRRAPRTSVLLAALGISIALESYLMVAWGSQRRVLPVNRVPAWLSAHTVPPGVHGSRAAFQFGVLPLTTAHSIPILDLLIVVVFVTIATGLFLFFRLSRSADAMVASADAPLAARACGIPVDRILGQAFFLGGAIASIGGTLYVLRARSVDPTSGFSPGILAFAACVLGGIGSLRGSIAGAFLTGLVISLAPAVPLGRWVSVCLPSDWLRFWPSLNLSDWSYGVVYLLMILVIMFKPEGLFQR